MAIIKKPGYQDPKLKKTQAILDKQPGAQFIAQKLPQSVLDAIAARRAQSGQPALQQATQPAAVAQPTTQPTTQPAVQPAVQPAAMTEPQRYKDSEDLSPQPTQTDFASGLDDRGLRQYNTYKELAKMKFPNANPDLIENIAQMQTQPYLDALKPQTKLSAVEKFELSDMGVSEAELSAYERGEVSFSEIMNAAKKYKEDRKLELEKTEEEKIAEAKRLLDIEYAPRYTRAAQSAGVSKSTIGRTMAATGRGVSSINTQKLQEAENIYQEQLAAIDAQKESAMMLREAQIQGATTEELDSLNAQYQRSRQALANAQAMSDQLQMEALQTAQQTGNTAMLDLIEAIAEETNNKNDADFDKNLTEAIGDGFAYGANGERLVNAQGQELTTSQQSFNSKYKRVGTQVDAFSGAILAIYEDKVTGQAYYEPMTELNRGATQPGYQPATSPGPNGFRTDRHRNPLAITTDVARQGGLQEGEDYTQGDPFLGKDKRTYYTANILTSDPMQTMVDVFDKIGFTTQSGGNRFDYLPGPQADANWATLSNEQKLEVVADQYMENEKGSGVLLSDTLPSAPQPTMTEAQPTTVRSTPLTSLRDRKMMEAEIEREIQAVATPKEISAFDKEQGKEDSVSSAVTLGKNIMNNRFIPMLQFFEDNKDAITPLAQPFSEEKREFKGMVNQLIVDLNKLYKLGALAGPDFGILMESVAYPDNKWSFAVPAIDREIAFKRSVLNKMTTFYNIALENALDLEEINTRFKDSQVFKVNRNNLDRWAEALDQLEKNVEYLTAYVDDPARLQKNINKLEQIEIQKLKELEKNNQINNAS